MIRPLRARGAPYEYWYLKTNGGDLAFLVDFIVRRPMNAAEVRLSYWVRGRGTVTHEVRDRCEHGASIVIGESEFGDSWTRGSSQGVSWEIRWVAGPRWLQPSRLGGALRAFPTEIVLCPGVRATGTVDVGGEHFALDAAPAVLSHYWGRGLPDRWVWLSANTVAMDAEALISRQRLWGMPFLRLDVGYAFVSTPEGTRYVISPLTGIVRAAGTRDDVRLRAWGPRFGGFDITARAGSDARNDLGEGITQTLLADGSACGHEIRGTMGLETRGWS